MAFTYGQLKAAIQEYTENTETQFVSNLPIFIRTAEERILKSVQLTIFRKNASAVTTVNDELDQQVSQIPLYTQMQVLLG